jgi:hypothetical protein
MAWAGIPYVDPSLVPVQTELAWERAPFDAWSAQIQQAFGLPGWKLRETSRNLQRIFDLAVAEGKSFDDAWAITECEISRILVTNGDLRPLT